MCAVNRQGNEDEGEGECLSVGDWWMEGQDGCHQRRRDRCGTYW